ncbi:MAG: hypothetical protein LBH95_07540, partial [Oscillospiraceae bacterium]|nr:hypothetical protein [Oscillospiraceae bacterium]
MNTKRIALLLSVLLVFGTLLTACGDTASPSPVTPSTAEASDGGGGGGGGLAWDDTPVVAQPKAIPDGAITFDDGRTGYLAFNLTPGNADPSVMSVIDYNGGKALKIETTEGGCPYLGIDISGLFGDRVADVREIDLRIWVEHPDGNFYASGGMLEAYTGESNNRSEFLWGVALDKSLFKELTAKLDDNRVFAPGAKNILVLTKTHDSAVTAGEHAANLIIDYIAFYDASGNIMTGYDTSASFEPPAGFGSADRSLLYNIVEEIQLDHLWDGAPGSCGAWGQAGFIDPAEIREYLVPGSIITVYYKSDDAPELIFQNYAGGTIGWGKTEPYTTNLTGNVAQFRYEDINFPPEEFEDFLDKLNVGGCTADLQVTKVTVGQRVEEELPWKPIVIGRAGFKDLTPLNEDAILRDGGYTPMVSPAAWKLCFRVHTINDVPEADDFTTGSLDPAWFVEGSYVTAYYDSET